MFPWPLFFLPGLMRIQPRPCPFGMSCFQHKPARTAERFVWVVALGIGLTWFVIVFSRGRAPQSAQSYTPGQGIFPRGHGTWALV